MSVFRLPTRVTLGAGNRSLLPDRLVDLGAARVMLVLDPGLGATPWPEEIAGLLTAAGARVMRFDRVEPNPRAATVEALAEELRSGNAEAVVGLGGGSVLDAAKAAAMLAANAGGVDDYVGKNLFPNRPLPFVAVPTTCGTGSEVTWVSVISVPERRVKVSVKGDGMFPDVALVDPDLVATLPSGLVASTGLDALTHALEAITGREANPASDALATRAVEMLFRHLEAAVGEAAAGEAATAGPGGRAEADGPPRAGAALGEVMTASTLAGMAFGNADVGAVHCLSETLGGFYDVPHGLANALLLAPVLRSHGPWVTAPLARLEPRLRGAGEPPAGSEEEAAERVIRAVESLVARLRLPSFSELGVPASDLEAVAAGAVANGSNASNPRPMGQREYLEILHDTL